MIHYKALISITLLFSLVNKSSAIYCYDCNSANNSACLNPMQFDEETRVKLIPLINCEISVPMVKPIDFFCRKIVQTIYRPHNSPEQRITRSCGWVVDEKPCYHAGSHDYMETVCQCFTNHCNDADTVESNTATLLFVALAACLYLYR